MESRSLMWCLIAVAMFAIANSAQSPAQQIRYKLVDIPTLGGPGAIGQVDGTGISQFINSAGVVVGGSDTSITLAGCDTCFSVHGFRWQDGVLTDLGTLPGNFSHAESINARGWATGGSFTGEFDPLNGQSAEHAVLWKSNEISDLGTLGTGRESAALYVNNAGEVVGFSTFDTKPDPSSFLGATIRAFIWTNGVMREIVPPGSRGSFPAGGCNNQRSDLLAGNDDTGMFLWSNGRFTNIPTLGGSMWSAQCANNAGQVIGGSDLPGDAEFHAFLWSQGTQTVLTLGGSFSVAYWLNSAGEVVGGSSTANDESFHAALWRNGQPTDLGTLDGDCFSQANAINSRGQIIGQSFSCPDGAISRAVLWDKGSIIDLNAVISNDAGLQLVETDNINDRGEIVGRGAPPGCDPSNLDLCGRVFLLTPCDRADSHACEENGGSSAKTPSATISTLSQSPEMTRDFIVQLRARLTQKYHRSGVGISK